MVSAVTSNLLALKQATDGAAKSSAATLASGGGAASSGASTQEGAFASMAKNETNFLTLLTAQLKHQDPSSPMNTENMASQLAQFSSVEQQVQTNTHLKSLIALNESAQLTQDKSMVGQIASVSTTTLPLQSGKGTLSFNAGAGDIIGVSVADRTGQIVKNDMLRAQGGKNNWVWNGQDNSGNQLADGAYSVSVKKMDSQGGTIDVPFYVSGKVTGVRKGDSGVDIMMGDAEAPLSGVQSLS